MGQTSVQILVFETVLGWFGLAHCDHGLCNSALFRANREELIERLLTTWPDGVLVGEAYLMDVVQRVRDYAMGHTISFDDLQLDWDSCSAFQRRVYEVVRRVPWGKTVSYGDVARAVNRPLGARAVGQAMSKNPLPLIVPCHRVIAADGGIGGFGGLSAVALKRKMLGLEGSFPHGFD